MKKLFCLSVVFSFICCAAIAFEFESNDGIHKLEGKYDGFDVKTDKVYIINKHGERKYILASKLTANNLTLLRDFHGVYAKKEEFKEKSHSFELGSWTTIKASRTLIIRINSFNTGSDVTIMYSPQTTGKSEDLNIRNIDISKLKEGGRLTEDIDVYFETTLSFRNKHDRYISLLSGVVDNDIGYQFEEFIKDKKKENK